MAPPAYKLLCLENPLLDIQAECDNAILEKYGLKANDAILAEEKHLTIYEELQKRDAKVIAGGAAQNTARGAQYLLPPNSVVYLGAVGKDSSAKALDDACEKAGLATAYARLQEHPTGRCGVVITGHNRSLVTELGAANHYKLEHLKSPDTWSLVESAEIFYVGGYHLTVSPDAAAALGEYASKTNKTFIMSTGAPFILEFFAEPFARLLPYCDYVIGNETEAASWAKQQGIKVDESASQTDRSIAIAKKIAESKKANEKRGRTVIITQGTDATVVVQGDKVSTYPVHAIDAKEINDTNGAGDAFAGGFLAGLVEGKSLAQSVDQGQWLAKTSIKELGPSYPYPKVIYQPSS